MNSVLTKASAVPFVMDNAFCHDLGQIPSDVLYSLGGYIMFSDKLDFLMRITNTSNSNLARALSFDSSYISKLRRGVRNLPAGKDFEKNAASFFTKRLNDKNTRYIVAEVVNQGSGLPEDHALCTKVLAEWLSSGNDSSKDTMTDFFHELSRVRPEGKEEHIKVKPLTHTKDVEIFYGNSGKREAVEIFLRTILTEYKDSRPLLLFSNEDMRWMYESADFAHVWGQLLSAALSRGIRIRIIHTVQRNLGDMIEAVRKWMPLYISGNIEPYYCPRLRDDIYKRSIFVAPGLIALTSDSIGDSTEEMPNILFRDKTAVAGFEKEYNDYLALCKPLMNIYSDDAARVFPSVLDNVLSSHDSICLAGSNPLFLLIPEKHLTGIPGEVKKELSELRKKYTDLLSHGVKVMEVFPFPTVDNISGGTSRVTIWPGCSIGYTEQVLKDHIREVIKLIEKYPNYEPKISHISFGKISIISSGYEKTVIMTSAPAIFEIYEQSISAAVNEYIGRIPGQSGREEILSTLKGIVN